MQEITAHSTDRGDLLAELSRSLDAAVERGELTGVIVLKIQRLRDMRIDYGYAEGDRIYDHFVDQLRTCLRQSDVVAPTGEDEFVLMLPGLKSQAQAVMAISKIRRTCCGPLEVNGTPVRIKLTSGASVGPEDAQGAEALLRCADLALRHAESKQLESVRYGEIDRPHGSPTLQLESALESAITTGGLAAYYQPIIDIETGCLTGVEMLSRWLNGPNDRAVTPDTFIKVAERSSLILPLTRWALNNSLRECAEWQLVLPNLPVSVNFSALVLADPHLPEIVHSTLKLWDAHAGRLTIEVTESSIMSDPASCLAVLTELHEAGIRIAIDDFGTGYSSLAYLKEMPVDILKIDQSFVRKMITNDADRRIVQTVIDLGHNFNLTVVAEGVEDEETLDTLTLMGCQRAQGYHVARPMPAAELYKWFSGSDWEHVATAESASHPPLDFELG